jgi:hypothetical protein
LYKERNVLLTEQTRARSNNMRLVRLDRKRKVSKSMARIKAVLADRRKAFLLAREAAATASSDS